MIFKDPSCNIVPEIIYSTDNISVHMDPGHWHQICNLTASSAAELGKLLTRATDSKAEREMGDTAQTSGDKMSCPQGT